MINEISIAQKTWWIAAGQGLVHHGVADAGQLLTSPFQIESFLDEQSWLAALAALGVTPEPQAGPVQE